MKGILGGNDTNHGLNMVRMLAEDDYGEISKGGMHKYSHGTKELQIKLSQQLFNFDDVKEGFDKDRKIGDGICGMKMLKKNMRGKNGRIIRNPWRSSGNR